ncbi:MAG: hypothetical protein A2987_05105 [Omnitrophica bacterium RIFCSPLOWO2_01_FULL_45_10]|nr:MAG: hypothetical protein A2987_05105 [Omnitrophica bacterium RIFCSPLOWO2_01_FULL_45_10]
MESAKKIFCDVTKCIACRTCEIACAVEHSTTKDLFLAMLERPRPKRRTFVHFIGRGISHSIACQHCDEPPCVEACMSSCISKNDETGTVDIDRSRCVGCWMCIMSCPFGIISRDLDDKNKAVKCDLCPERECPACVDACPTNTLSYETRDTFSKRIKDKDKGYGKK